MRPPTIPATGGFNKESLLYRTWEAVICAGLRVVLIVLFRQVFRRTNRLLAAMSVASLAAYVLHWIIVVGIDSDIEGFDLPALVKFGFVTALATLLAFGLGHWSRRIPGVRVILGTTPSQPRSSAPHETPATEPPATFSELK